MAALLWLAPAVALAEEPKASPEVQRVAVLPLQIEGALETHWRQLLEGRLLGRLKGAVEVVAPDEVARALSDNACTDAPCFRRITAAVGADFALAARLVVADNDYLVRVELIDGETGRSVAAGGGGCEFCGVQEVGDLLADHTVILRQKVEAMSNAPPVVSITSNPPDAMVFIDGELVGKTPLERTVGAGAHEVRAEKDGFIAQVGSFVATPGGAHAQQLVLDPVPKIQRARPWAWGMLGLGSVGVAAGTTLLVLDGRPYRRFCDGDNVDASGRCRFTIRTQAQGIVYVGLGASAIVAAAIILRVSGRSGRRARAPAAARLQPAAQGIAVRF